MHRFLRLVDNYKSTTRLDNETAWNIICCFGKLLAGDTMPEKEHFWCIMRDVHEQIKGKHFDEVYANWKVDEMYHTDEKGNKISKKMFNEFDAKKIYDKQVRSISNEITHWDVYVALNAQYHDNIELYEKWFKGITEEEMKEKIIESCIMNWFEDEDADNDKVWNYFKVI